MTLNYYILLTPYVLEWAVSRCGRETRWERRCDGRTHPVMQWATTVHGLSVLLYVNVFKPICFQSKTNLNKLLQSFDFLSLHGFTAPAGHNITMVAKVTLILLSSKIITDFKRKTYAIVIQHKLTEMAEFNFELWSFI